MAFKRVLVVDDCSPEQPGELFRLGPLKSLATVDVLPLRRNLGHQRAIAIGLAYVEQHIDNRCVVVMDSDGEDSPEDVPRLLASSNKKGATRSSSPNGQDDRKRSFSRSFT